MEGILDGETISAETDGDGAVLISGKGIFGENLTASTEDGDIVVDTECRSDNVYFTTKNGDIHTNSQMFNKTCAFNINDRGDISAEKISTGELEVSVRKGNVDIFVESITSDSSIAVTSGKVNLTVPLKCSFKLWLSAPMTNIASKIQNSGELILSEDNGNEEFSTENTSKNGQVPILRVGVHQGSIQVNVAEKDQDGAPAAVKNFDSATETS